MRRGVGQGKTVDRAITSIKFIIETGRRRRGVIVITKLTPSVADEACTQNSFVEYVNIGR